MKKLKLSIILLLIVFVSCTPTPTPAPAPAPNPVPVTNPNPTTSPTVTIGTQIWTTKNLDVSTYRNGDPIPQVQDTVAWANLTTGAWCYYRNNTTNGAIYGKLYNWYAVNDPRGLAPIGYHIPTKSEWQILTDYLGGTYSAGGKMKSTGTQYWKYPNVGATNESGFSALPAGYLNFQFYYIGKEAHWWSSTYSTNCVFGVAIEYGSFFVTENPCKSRNSGHSVRCIKD